MVRYYFAWWKTDSLKQGDDASAITFLRQHFGGRSGGVCPGRGILGDAPEGLATVGGGEVTPRTPFLFYWHKMSFPDLNVDLAMHTSGFRNPRPPLP